MNASSIFVKLFYQTTSLYYILYVEVQYCARVIYLGGCLWLIKGGKKKVAGQLEGGRGSGCLHSLCLMFLYEHRARVAVAACPPECIYGAECDCCAAWPVVY